MEGRPRLPGISKRRDRYIRYLPIHGSRAVLCYAGGTKSGVAARRLKTSPDAAETSTRHRILLAVVLVIKIALAAWVVLAKAAIFL